MKTSIFLSIIAIVPTLFACSGRIDGTINCGSSNGEFSVSNSTKVLFSKGNLQYQPSTNTWRFAEKQNEVVKKDNANISESYSGWIDLFGWGTSGWDSGAKEFKPYTKSQHGEDYSPNNNSSADLEGQYANADWGVYNQISNGGNEVCMWRTLSSTEWSYLLKSRQHAAQLFGRASVDGVWGLIILPDDWQAIDDVNFIAQAEKFTTNTYNSDDWSKMEDAGAIFLPCAGYRYGNMVYDVDNDKDPSGDYWSTTHDDTEYAFCMYFDAKEVEPVGSYARFRGHAVRLVCDVN